MNVVWCENYLKVVPNLNVGYETPYEVYTNSHVFVFRKFVLKFLEAVTKCFLLADFRFEEKLFMIIDAVFSAKFHL